MLKGIAITAGVLVAGIITANALVIQPLNGLARDDEYVNKKFADIQIQLQASNEELPNLVKIVERAAGHENSTLKDVAEARAGLTAVGKMKPSELANDPEARKQLIEAQSRMDNVMMKMNSVVEKYPQLQALPLFKDTMRTLSGNTNNVKQARREAQAAVTMFNTEIRMFPKSMLANMAGYQRKPDFAADEDSKKMPKLDFGTKG